MFVAIWRELAKWIKSTFVKQPPESFTFTDANGTSEIALLAALTLGSTLLRFGIDVLIKNVFCVIGWTPEKGVISYWSQSKLPTQTCTPSCQLLFINRLIAFLPRVRSRDCPYVADQFAFTLAQQYWSWFPPPEQDQSCQAIHFQNTDCFLSRCVRGLHIFSVSHESEHPRGDTTSDPTFPHVSGRYKSRPTRSIFTML